MGEGVYLWVEVCTCGRGHHLCEEACHSEKRCVIVGLGMSLRKEGCPSKSRCVLVEVGKYLWEGCVLVGVGVSLFEEA